MRRTNRTINFAGFRSSVLIGLPLVSGLLLLYTFMNSELSISTLKTSIIQHSFGLEKGKDNNIVDIPAPYELNSFPYTDFSTSFTKSGAKFWESIKPGFNCPSGLLSRIGKSGDGGKWMCGLETLGKLNTKNGRKCTLYSFGVNKDSSYEAAVLKIAPCSIHAYDPTVNEIGSPLKTSAQVHFQKIGIAGNNTDKHRTLKTLMKENGHEFIDILKVDVEGAEYESLENIFQDFDQMPFGQLLIEFHSWSFKDHQFRQMLSYLVNLEVKGARIFSVEKNTVVPQYCAEFSFINLNYLKLFLPDNVII